MQASPFLSNSAHHFAQQDSAQLEIAAEKQKAQQSEDEKQKAIEAAQQEIAAEKQKAQSAADTFFFSERCKLDEASFFYSVFLGCLIEK